MRATALAVSSGEARGVCCWSLGESVSGLPRASAVVGREATPGPPSGWKDVNGPSLNAGGGGVGGFGSILTPATGWFNIETAGSAFGLTVTVGIIFMGATRAMTGDERSGRILLGATPVMAPTSAWRRSNQCRKRISQTFSSRL